MKLQIRKWGNSAGVLLPISILDGLRVRVGDELSVDIEKGVLKLAPSKPSYTLDGLMKLCNKKAPMPVEAKEWEVAQPVGREAW